MSAPVIIGDATLYLGDCLEILPTLDKGSIDAVVTDPPYGEKTHNGARSNKTENAFLSKNPIDFNSVDANFLRDAFGLCSPNRWLVSFIDWKHCLPLEMFPPSGLEFVRFGVWTKLNPMPQITGDRPGTGWEAIAIFHPAGKKRWNGGSASAVWTHGTSRYGCFRPSSHPTEKPLDLVKNILAKFTDKEEIVLDPFMGSGTTGVACVQTGRKFIGIEIEERYFEIACRRIEAAQRQGRMEFSEKANTAANQQNPIFFEATA